MLAHLLNQTLDALKKWTSKHPYQQASIPMLAHLLNQTLDALEKWTALDTSMTWRSTKLPDVTGVTDRLETVNGMKSLEARQSYRSAGPISGW
jgi:hypothetical protein